jgi:small subunit ribosomal protein S9
MNPTIGAACLRQAVRQQLRVQRSLQAPLKVWLQRRPFLTSLSQRAVFEDKIISFPQDDGSILDFPEDGKTDFTAAPPIDANIAPEDREIYNHPLPLLKRVRIVPDSPSYFSGQPDSTDEYLHIQSLYLRYLALPRIEGFEEEGSESKSKDVDKQMGDTKNTGNRWTTFDDFRANAGRPMKKSRYDEIITMLDSLAAIEPVLLPSSVSAVIQRHRVVAPQAKIERIRPVPDEWGRAMGVGARKAANAKVYLVKGEGEVLINDRILTDVFPRLHDRESALWPLKITNRMDQYNIWALVNGGGRSGQAEAITLAISRALLVHEPDLFSRLFQGKLYIPLFPLTFHRHHP